MKNYIIIPFLIFGLQLHSQNNWFHTYSKTDKEEKSTITVSSKLPSSLQVSNKTFNKLIFKDLNYLILGDDSPQQGISLEYKEDLSSLKLSGYLADFKWKKKENGFVTLDGEFKTKTGIYFFDKEKGGTQAKVTGNVFFTLHSYRRYISLFSKKDNKPVWDKARQQAYIRSNYRKIQLLQELYTKYSALAAIANDVNYPMENLSISETLLENARSYLKDFELEFNFIKNLDFDLAKYKNEYALESKNEFQNKVKLKGKEKRRKKQEAEENGENFEAFTINETENVTIQESSYNLSKVFAELKDLKNKIDSVGYVLEKIEIEEAQEIWKSKHIWYMGISPFYARESLEIFEFNENLNTSKQFSTSKKDLYGININGNYFIQNKKEWLNRFYFKANLEFAKSSNFADLILSQVRATDSLGVDGDGNLLEVVTEKNAYHGTKDYLEAFKYGISLESYLWILNDFGIFTKIGYNNYNYSGEETNDTDDLPWRLGLMYEFNNLKKSGKIAVVQAFLDRNDLQNHPQAKDQNLRFGFKVGIPINVKSKL